MPFASSPVQLIECPRDAMQGLHDFIPTELKVAYLNQLLQVGFHTLDFGSFVSPKAIPQLRDTAQVLQGLQKGNSQTRLLAIVANLRGAEEALTHLQIDFLGFPLSLSETFQQRNTNKSVTEAFETVAQIQQRCLANNRAMVVYLSMGFGNPYGDPYSQDLVEQSVAKLHQLGVEVVSLSDTVGSATVEEIKALYTHIHQAFPEMQVGLHLHSRYEQVYEKACAALEAGCQRLDSALQGFGGCPMAGDSLVGNMATEEIIRALQDKNAAPILNTKALQESLRLAGEIFPARC